MDRAEDRIALIEVLDRDGRVARAVDVHRWPLSLGRALDNQLVLDDPHVAASHARLLLDDQGGLQLDVGDSRNGVLLDGKPVAGGSHAALPAGGALLQLGTTRLRLRLRDEVLAPERVLLQRTLRVGPMLALLAALAAWAAALHWVTLDPGADLNAWTGFLLGAPVVLLLWCGGWALASKLFQHHFDLWGHARIVLPALLVLVAADTLLPQVAASLGWAWLWQLSSALAWGVVGVLVYRHLVHVAPQHPRAMATVVVLALVAFGGSSVIGQLRSRDTWQRAPYMSSLPLPMLRLHGADPASALVADMAPLRDQIAARVRKARTEDDEASGAEESNDE